MLFVNVVSLFAPLFGLVCLVFLREALLDQSAAFINEIISVPIPQFFNVPLQPFSTFASFTFFNVSECNEWYLYKFNPNTTNE